MKEINARHAIIAITSILLFVVVIITIALTLNFNGGERIQKENEVKNTVQQMKTSYKEQGIDLNDSDIKVQEDDETGQIIVEIDNEEKHNNFKYNINKQIKQIYSNKTGIDLEYYENNPSDLEEDSYIPKIDIDEVIDKVNYNLSSIKEYLINASEYNQKTFEKNYVQMLLDQRQTDIPDSNSTFPIIITINKDTSYKELQYRLNGQCFLNITYPNRVVLDDYKYFSPYVYSFYSEDLFNNILNSQTYEKEFNEDDILSVSESEERLFVLNTNESDQEYVSVIDVETKDSIMILGIENGEFILLDIISK